MKKLLAFILCLLCILNVAYSESPATPTDLVEIDDDDWGTIEIIFERKVYIDVDTNDNLVTMTAILVNFNLDDIVTFHWQYALQIPDWIFIEGATEQTYTFTLDETTINYWFRVMVEWEEIE